MAAPPRLSFFQRALDKRLSHAVLAQGVPLMSLHLVNLNDQIRQFMLEEIERDIANNQLYLSPRLSGTGLTEYPNLIREAARGYDDDWLATSLRNNCRLNASEQRRTKSGYTTVKVPITAPETLSEGEFNRFYARGLCRFAVSTGVAALQVYRAKAVMVARSASEAMIGSLIDATALLQDLRTHKGVDTALGLPPGPNSGLSVKLPNT